MSASGISREWLGRRLPPFAWRLAVSGGSGIGCWKKPWNWVWKECGSKSAKTGKARNRMYINKMVVAVKSEKQERAKSGRYRPEEGKRVSFFDGPAMMPAASVGWLTCEPWPPPAARFLVSGGGFSSLISS